MWGVGPVSVGGGCGGGEVLWMEGLLGGAVGLWVGFWCAVLSLGVGVCVCVCVGFG